MTIFCNIFQKDPCQNLHRPLAFLIFNASQQESIFNASRLLLAELRNIKAMFQEQLKFGEYRYRNFEKFNLQLFAEAKATHTATRINLRSIWKRTMFI